MKEHQPLYIPNFKPIPRNHDLDLSEPTIQIDINPDNIPEQYPEQYIIDEPAIREYLGITLENGRLNYSWEWFDCF